MPVYRGISPDLIRGFESCRKYWDVVATDMRNGQPEVWPNCESASSCTTPRRLTKIDLDSDRSYLCLQQQLDTLDGSDSCLGDGSGHTTRHEVSKELDGRGGGGRRSGLLRGSGDHEGRAGSADADRPSHER